MHTALTSTTPTHRPLIARLLQECSTDLQRACGEDAGAGGALLATLDSYWDSPARQALLIRFNDCPVGVALVEHHCVFGQAEGHTIVALCVERTCRRLGVGQSAARQIFDMFPGRWEIATSALNVPATAFWRGVVDRYTDGRYDERWLHAGRYHYIVQLFQAQPPCAAL